MVSLVTVHLVDGRQSLCKLLTFLCVILEYNCILRCSTQKVIFENSFLHNFFHRMATGT